MIISNGQIWKRIHPLNLGMEDLIEGTMNSVKVSEIISENGEDFIYYHSMWKLRINKEYESRCIRRDIFIQTYEESK
jgi:hypothetical protein